MKVLCIKNHWYCIRLIFVELLKPITGVRFFETQCSSSSWLFEEQIISHSLDLNDWWMLCFNWHAAVLAARFIKTESLVNEAGRMDRFRVLASNLRGEYYWRTGGLAPLTSSSLYDDTQTDTQQHQQTYTTRVSVIKAKFHYADFPETSPGIWTKGDVTGLHYIT